MPHILQPQRDINREKGRESQREREGEREQVLLLLVLRHYITKQYIFTSVLGDRTSFRVSGLRLTPQNRNFTAVF